MRIAMFTESYLPYINGVVTHVKSLKDGLERAGHQVLIVTVDVKARHHHLEGDVLYCPGKELKRLYDYGLANPFSRTRFRIIQQFHPDIIHIHTEFGVGLSAVRIARKLQIPYVYTLHTMYEDYLYYVAPKPFIPMVRIMSRRYFKYFAQHSQAVTGPSAKVQEYLDECHADRKVNVVPNPVELDKFSPDKVNWDHVAQLKQKYGFEEGELIAGFCGRLGREKSVDVLLDYFSQEVKREDGIKLMIIGDGPSRPELVELSQKLGISDLVTFVGAVDHNEILDYYACLDVYVTASLSDTNSISMLEGMATGLPVLHINDPLNAGQVQPGVNGFIYKDAKELYRLLLEQKQRTPQERKILSASVRQSVQSSGQEALANYLLAIYQQVEGEGSSRNRSHLQVVEAQGRELEQRFFRTERTLRRKAARRAAAKRRNKRKK